MNDPFVEGYLVGVSYREQWQEEGCLVIPQAFTPERIDGLQAACNSAYEYWKANSSEDGEPAGYSYKPNAWCLFHINHPRYYHGHREQLRHVLEAAADPFVTGLLRDIFRQEVGPLQINLYIDPPGPGPANPANWHRDSQFSAEFAPGDEAERQVVLETADPPRELHMHIPVVPSSASEVVPGSQRRWDTEEELRIRLQDPTSEAMPNARRLHLESGDIAFFHVNALHRGRYTPGVPRRTIAITYGLLSQPRFATCETMRDYKGYIPTFQPWYKSPGYLEGLSPAARQFYQGFIDVYHDNWKPELAAPEVVGAERHLYFTRF